MPHRIVVVLAVVLAAWLVSPPARAGTDGAFAWDQPSAEEQLLADQTIIPLGKGALLVPAMSDPAAEPPVILVGPGEEIHDAPTGKRVLLDPGRYTVIATSGAPNQGVAVAVEVLEAETTVVPVTWGALRIEVTDQRRVPHRGGYELIKADTREPYGTGFGADTLQGESLFTWLLPPGVYRVVKVGANYRALRDFATVYVPESGFVRFRLVTDKDNGDFLGSGILLPEDWGTTKSTDRPWFTSMVVGIDGALVQQRNVVGVQDQLLLTGDVFIDGQFVWHEDGHTFSSLLEIEEGMSWIRPLGGEPLPLVKSRDRVRGDLLYTFFPNNAIGPYARAAAQTRVFRTDLLVAENTTVRRIHADRTVTDEEVRAGSTFHIADAWSPTIVREGVGLNTRFLNNRWFTLNLRAGFGLRQSRYSGAWVLDDDDATPEIEFSEIESFDEAGVESTIVANVRLPGWATYATDIELFADFDHFGEPSLEWRNTLSLRLTRNLSINYYLNVDVFPQVVERAQIEQSLLLRASFELL